MKKLKIFERNEVPLKIKILGIAIYIQTSSTKKTAKILFECYPVSHNTVHKWTKKFEEKLPISTKKRNLIAIDETVVKANRKKYYVYSAVDINRNELILMKVYTTRNYLTTKSFVKEVLNYCDNKLKFVVDQSNWLRKALKSLRLEFKHDFSNFGLIILNLIESTFILRVNSNLKTIKLNKMSFSYLKRCIDYLT